MAGSTKRNERDHHAVWDDTRASVIVLTTLLASAAAVAVFFAAVVVARRWGVWRWLAVVTAGPALLVIAQRPVGAGAALVLFSAAVVTLCWRADPRYAQVPLAFVLLLSGVLVSHLAQVSPPRYGVVVPGPPSLATFALAMAAGAGLGRSRSVPLRAVVMLTLALPVLVFVATGSTDVDRRLVAGLGRPRRHGPAAWGARTPCTRLAQADHVDRAALDDFAARYGVPTLAPVAVVIAAYDEAIGLPAVVASIPSTVADHEVELVVVDDGSSDGTAEAAQHAGAKYVVRCPSNRGQGAALRLGYRVAREHGAAYLITTDADGQYDVADFATVLTPILEDRADFVTGSRRLGHQPVQDPLRRLGVHVFAWLVGVLTGQRLTDTSFGLRAMRAEVTAAVTLNQPQYQSSELLIGALSHGFRVAEVPGTMLSRSVGSSKKGRNLVYGRRYAQVVLGTWWREGCPAPVSACPAMGGSRDHGRQEARTRPGAQLAS